MDKGIQHNNSRSGISKPNDVGLGLINQGHHYSSGFYEKYFLTNCSFVDNKISPLTIEGLKGQIPILIYRVKKVLNQRLSITNLIKHLPT